VPHRATLWLVLLVVLAYANSLNGVFQFDDYNVIVDQSVVHGAAAWLQDWGEGIRPLLKLSYMLNWEWDASPIGFHFVNLLIHGANVLVVYQLSTAMLQTKGLLVKQHHTAWFAAALFAVHPAHTEAVTYICGRSSSLMTLLFLTGCWVHVTLPSAKWPRMQQWLAPLCMLMALGVKETAVTFPLALLLWDRFAGLGWQQSLRNAWRCWMVLLLAAVFFLLNAAYRDAMSRSLEFNSLLGNVATQLTAVLYLLRQWALPLWLNIDPDLPVQQDLSRAWPALFILAGALWVMVCKWRTKPFLAFAIGWVLLDWFSLYLFLPRLDVANDRQLYLVTWPLGLALLVGLQGHLPERQVYGVAAVVVMAFAGLTVQRNQNYHSEVALWEQTAALSPNKSRVHNNLGYAYMQAGRTKDARREYLRALQLDAANIKARLNLRRMNAANLPEQRASKPQ
jgi:tetratricopeptide (TPR) repeat protein